MARQLPVPGKAASRRRQGCSPAPPGHSPATGKAIARRGRENSQPRQGCHLPPPLTADIPADPPSRRDFSCPFPPRASPAAGRLAPGNIHHPLPRGIIHPVKNRIPPPQRESIPGERSPMELPVRHPLTTAGEGTSRGLSSLSRAETSAGMKIIPFFRGSFQLYRIFASKNY